MDIDVVMLWVDSSDELWRNKINQYLEKKIDWENKEESTRYNSINEIEISIRSVIKNASFVRNIFLVTDNQKPKRFRELKELAQKNNINLKLIDHKDIFVGYEEYLPTFNNRCIEALIYKIEGLSEHFLYLNDDFFIINKTNPDDFFKDGKPILRGRWKSNVEFTSAENNSIEGEATHQYAKEYSASIVGFNNKYYNFHHTPYPLRKSTIQFFFNENPDLLENNLKYKFRNKNQFLLQCLINHVEIKNNTCDLKKGFSLIYTHDYSWYKILRKTIITDLKRKKKLFMCLQSLETVSERKLRFLLKWIDKKLDSNFANEL
ncbi:Stealth CR1 domain-containing protein [Tenacibaculum sp. A30]|uniref:Stealth CR1 domain-containing protein n=1 Tax=Tenacibaculum sp. A30 TaxID=3442644 RepID=UPI003EBF07C4